MSRRYCPFKIFKWTVKFQQETGTYTTWNLYKHLWMTWNKYTFEKPSYLTVIPLFLDLQIFSIPVFEKYKVDRFKTRRSLIKKTTTWYENVFISYDLPGEEKISCKVIWKTINLRIIKSNWKFMEII